MSGKGGHRVEYAAIDAPFGAVAVVSQDAAVVGVALGDAEVAHVRSTCRAAGRGALAEEASRQLGEYLAGSRRTFTVPVDFVACTEFQRRVLFEMTQIPYGGTRTYGELAVAANHAGAARAVGRACAENPVPLIVPCHRVVAASGLGGYSGGLDVKRFLLELEAGTFATGMRVCPG